MSKLVDLKRLEQLAKALDSRMKSAVALKVDSSVYEAKVAEIAAKDSAQDGKISALEGKVAALEAGTYDDTEVRGLVSAAQAKADQGVADAAAAQAAADAVQAEMNAFKAAAEVGDAAIDTLKEIQAYIESDAAAAEQMVKDIASKVAQADYDAKVAELEAEDERLDGAIATAKSEAIAAAEAKAAELDAALKAELQKEIDDDVKVVSDDLALEKAKIVALQEFQAGHKDYDDSAVKSRLEALESFKNSHKDYDDSALQSRVEAVEEFVEGYEAFDPSELEAAIALKADASVVEALSGEVAKKADKSEVEAELAKKAVASEVTTALALKAEASALSSLADEVALKAVKSDVEAELLKKVDKVEGKSLISDAEIARLAQVDNYDDSALAGRVSDLESFKNSHKDYDDTALVGRVAALEAIDHDFAAADTALHNTIKAEMSAVVSSLKAEITEAGTLKLSLGGSGTVATLCEKELPFASEAEIEAIIAGLDA